MRRADRLFQIVQHLRARRLTTAAQLAEWLEVIFPRTIYRDVRDFRFRSSHRWARPASATPAARL
jgi:predicted DNA-binding transcriptional regulator YafY